MAEELEALRKYLDQNPSVVESIRRTSYGVLEQYRLAESARISVARQTEQFAQSALEAFRTMQTPIDNLKKFQQQMAEIFPKNWRGVPFDADRMQEVLETDGIPIVHVPRSSIVKTILDADDFETRVKIIEGNMDDIADDCEKALEVEFDSWFDKHVPLARRAIEAYRNGHHEAAQALAVSVCDTYFKKFLVGKSYKKMATAVSMDEANTGSIAVSFNVLYALVPGVSFLTEWRPESATEPPTKFSRHVSIHFANVDQMTKFNATLAIMFMTSLTVAIDYAARRVGGTSS
ncbi:hypothetical protein MPNTM1_04554 [Mycolicibacterium parafortuitum]|uniref:hypothetical protein n=1 Tax=Mycolicibacterium parafortuitum TaxID=39692 RepID=UPI0032C482B0